MEKSLTKIDFSTSLEMKNTDFPTNSLAQNDGFSA